MKFCIKGQGHMTKMADMAICSKNLQNQKACDFETWHEALGNAALQSHDPGMTFTYFMARSTYFANAFEWRK